MGKGFWKKAAKVVGKVAPLLGSALAGPGGGAVGQLVAGALGVDANEDEVIAAIERDPNAAVELKRIETEHRTALERMRLEESLAEIAADSEALSQVNETMRVEYTVGSMFKSGWRPFYGWMSALVTAGIVTAYVFVVVQFGRGAITGDAAAGLATLTGALMPILGIMLAVLGVNAGHRSRDKALLAGAKRPPSVLEAVASAFNRSGAG